MKSLSFRISKPLAAAVARATERWSGVSDSDRYRRIVEEWVRLQEHPGVRFVDGPAGRRVALVSGPDLWEVISILRAYDFDLDAARDAYPWLTADRAASARCYYEAFPEEIDARIADNERSAADLEHEMDLLVREDPRPDQDDPVA